MAQYPPTPRRVMWFRRDLRLGDHPALLAALGELADGDVPGAVLPLFVVDPALWEPAGAVRRAYVSSSLAALARSLRDAGGDLVLRTGNPVDVLPEVAKSVGASEVHITADFGPHGASRDQRVETVLRASGISLLRTGSPYAVTPGQVRKADSAPYSVFTPFARAWRAFGWRAPLPPPTSSGRWLTAPSDPMPHVAPPSGVTLPVAGEAAALHRWDSFRADGLAHYDKTRDRPDIEGTSALSAALRFGEVHPRTLLADLGDSRAHDIFRNELAWREFYADVLHRQPSSARTELRPDMAAMAIDTGSAADARFQAWAMGHTGYPFIDAGMRQLLAEGWMHNRVRMVVASFLVKDLHLDWRRGARHFMAWLRDGDLASNQHGWQWVAGTGTDAAPYFRVFNPVTQGLRFDPDGEYVRRYVPELHQLAGSAAHTPWDSPLLSGDYPTRIVDHAQERIEALARLAAVKDAAS